jgi:hypothetical protein
MTFDGLLRKADVTGKRTAPEEQPDEEPNETEEADAT